MSAYPLSSLPQHRWCRNPVCPTYPCIHTESHDPDWLENTEEAFRDPDYHSALWYYFLTLSYPEIKQQTPPEKWASYEVNFDRCRRIEAKRDQIDKDISDNIQRRREQSQALILTILDGMKIDPYIRHVMRERELLKIDKLW